MLAPKRHPASAARQQEILRAVATERLSLRAAERVFGVARQTIAKWLEIWLAYEEVFPRRTHRLCGKAEGPANHVERWNCTLRQRLGRFVRKTLSCFKCNHMHELALRLFIHEYNQQPITC